MTMRAVSRRPRRRAVMVQRKNAMRLAFARSIRAGGGRLLVVMRGGGGEMEEGNGGDGAGGRWR